MSDTKPQLLCGSLASPLGHRRKENLSLFHTVKPTCSMRTCTYCIQPYTAATSPVSTCIISKITRALLTLIPKGGLQGCHFQEPSAQVQSFTSLALWEISLMGISPLTLRSSKAQRSPILTQCSHLGPSGNTSLSSARVLMGKAKRAFSRRTQIHAQDEGR